MRCAEMRERVLRACGPVGARKHEQFVRNLPCECHLLHEVTRWVDSYRDLLPANEPWPASYAEWRRDAARTEERRRDLYDEAGELIDRVGSSAHSRETAHAIKTLVLDIVRRA